MPSTCIFELDRRDGIYFSGETINGHLHLNTTSDKPDVAIYIRIHGEGKVRLYSKNIAYCGEETYLDTRTTVFAGGTLPAGTHTYTICIPLPPLCPSTCNLKVGKIRYELSLVIERSYKYNNVFKQPITMIQHLDLNGSSGNLVPLQAQASKYPRFWRSQPLSFTLHVPRGSYIPGESIECLVSFDNQTSKTSNIEYCVSLTQIYTFKASRPGKKNHIETKILTEKHRAALCEARKITTHNNALLISPTQPTSPEEYIISVAYVLKLNIDLGFFRSNLELSLPIIVGTVPNLQSYTLPFMTRNESESGFHEDIISDYWPDEVDHHWHKNSMGTHPTGRSTSVNNHLTGNRAPSIDSGNKSCCGGNIGSHCGDCCYEFLDCCSDGDCRCVDSDGEDCSGCCCYACGLYRCWRLLCT